MEKKIRMEITRYFQDTSLPNDGDISVRLSVSYNVCKFM